MRVNRSWRVLLGKDTVKTILIGQVGGNQLLVTSQQVEHGSFPNGETTVTESLVQFCQAVMLTIPERSDQRNHIQTIFPIWQCPLPFCFGAVGLVITRAGCSLAPSYCER